MKSIRTTLIKRFTLILVITFLFLISAIVSINIKTSHANLVKTEQQIRNALIEKGKLLTFNNSHALQSLVEENAFSDIRQLIAETVKLDKDIIYGIYMDDKQQAWVVADINNPTGKLNKLEKLHDPVSMWANRVAKVDYHLHQQNTIGIYEFAAPIWLDKDRLGTVRFGLSTAAMEITLKQALLSSRQIIRQSILILVGLGLLSILMSYFAIRKMAKTITQPISILTESTKKIAAGDYDSEIKINSNNEIGQLSHSFNYMRVQMKDVLNKLLENQKQINEKNIALEITQNELTDLNQNLEQKVLERTAELRETQAQLVESARAAGVAEVAIHVLHNIGNVLNSVNVINQTNYEIIKKSKTHALVKTMDLLAENEQQMNHFLSTDSRGKKVPLLLLKLAQVLENENKSLEENSYRMLNSISMMTTIISTQQENAKTNLLQESFQLSVVLDEAINIQANLIQTHHVQLMRHYHKVADIVAEKAKVYQVINNLLVNAIESCESDNSKACLIRLDIAQEKGYIIFQIKDNGIGIKAEDQTKIFQHGFTTKKTGHGFGLHSCANLMTEMGGKMQVLSEGLGKGACFKLMFPVKNA